MKKTVLITGASSGIGLEFAEIFAKNGDNVILVARSGDKLNEIKEYLTETYGNFNCCFIKDLSKPNAAKELLDEVTSNGFEVDYLINNAGFGDNRKYLDADFEIHEKMVKLNVIGLIEVMGLAILPARLKKEMALLEEAILAGKDIRAIEEIEKHADWVEQWRDNYDITSDNINQILKDEIAKVFVEVLECAGVYKRTEEGQKAFKRFASSL